MDRANQKYTELTPRQKRMGDEGMLTSLFFGLSLSLGGLFLDRIVILLGSVLWVIGLTRKRAVNHSNSDRADRTLFVTNPLIEILSIFIAYYTVSNIVDWAGVGGLREQVLLYSAFCLLFSLIILFVEHFLVGDYFRWWGQRALNHATEDGGFWHYVAYYCFDFSGYAQSPEERRKQRSRRRPMPNSFKPASEQYQPPVPELSWGLTLIKWLVTPGRALSFVIGWVLFTHTGFPFVSTLLLTSVVFITSSFLADQIKYLYFYWPLRDRKDELEVPNTFSNRVILIARSYWISTPLSFALIWMVF